MRAYLAFLLLLATAPRVMAAQAVMGDVSVNLPTPAGFCELSDKYPADARALSRGGGLLSQAGYKLLGLSADCAQLAGWRAGTRQLLDGFAQYQTLITSIDKAPSASETIAQACADARAQGDKIISSLNARIEAAFKNIKMNPSTFLGVLAEDPDACYSGLLESFARTEAGTQKVQVNLYAVTTVKNRTIFVSRYTVYTGLDSVFKMLAELKKDVANLYAANK